MSKKKYYAVIRGHKPGIYESWSDCKNQINGYSGALFKSFKTKGEAENFIANHEMAAVEEKYEIEDYNLEVEKDLSDGRVVVFTDGSYSGKGKPVSGYGCVILTPERKIQEISDIVYTDRYKTSNNIGPEVMAVLESLKWVLSNEYKFVTIYHDLNLIGKWANGEYNANSSIAKLFLRELNEKYKLALDIEFKWVPGHKGIKYNERADTLAREAIYRKKPVSRYGKNSFMGRGVDKRKVDQIIDEFKKYNDITYTLKEENESIERHVFEYNKEKLTVTYFKAKGTTLLQGKVEHLFSEFLSKYTMHIQGFEMVKAYSDSFKQRIEYKQIEEVIKSYSLPTDYPDDIITLLKQSNIFLNLDRKEYDYSHYTMPSLRALEGHFKYLAAKEGVIIPIKKRLGSYFNFDKATNRYVLNNSEDAKTLRNSSNVTKLEDIYNFLYLYRNPLFHFGSVDETGDGEAYLIKNIDEAKDIINKAIKLIIT